MTINANISPANSLPPVAPPVDARDSMRRLPAVLQPALTWVTGKALPDEAGWRLVPAHHLAASVVPLLAGVGSGVAIMSGGGWWFVALPMSWLLTTHGMRKLASVILHQCTHGNFSRRRSANICLGRTISVALMAEEYTKYAREHIAEHHSASHMTLQDPTAQFIVLTMGCRPGMSRRRMWHTMLRLLLSPAFHLRACGFRLATHFRGTGRRYRLMVGSLLLTAVAAATAAQIWTYVLVVWVVPLTVLFNIAAVLRLSCRHMFPVPDRPLTGRAAIASYTHGIFLGEAVPAAGLSGSRWLAAWTRWWARMLLLHLPVRLFVMVGDGPCHDYHHRFPKATDWSNYLFRRRDDILAGHPKWPPYTEVWGLRAAIDAVFDSLRMADPLRYGPAAAGAVHQVDPMAAFKE